MRVLIAFVFWFLSICQAYSATITFDQIDCEQFEITSETKDFGVNWNSNNFGVYNYCDQQLLLGDDGWDNRTTFSGTNFSVQAFDWTGGTVVTEPTLPFLTIEGYRFGTLVAVDVIFIGDLISDSGRTSRGGAHSLTGFNDLDTFHITLNQVNYGGPTSGCDLSVAQCGIAYVDNVVVNNPTPIPLPGGLPLMSLAAGLFFVLRTRASTIG